MFVVRIGFDCLFLLDVYDLVWLIGMVAIACFRFVIVCVIGLLLFGYVIVWILVVVVLICVCSVSSVVLFIVDLVLIAVFINSVAWYEMFLLVFGILVICLLVIVVLISCCLFVGVWLRLVLCWFSDSLEVTYCFMICWLNWLLYLFACCAVWLVCLLLV